MSFLNKSQILLFRKQSTLQPTAVAQAAHMKEKKITLPNKQQQGKKERKLARKVPKTQNKNERKIAEGTRCSSGSPLHWQHTLASSNTRRKVSANSLPIQHPA